MLEAKMHDRDNVIFRERLVRITKVFGKPQNVVAKAISISYQTYLRFLNGKEISTSTLNKIEVFCDRYEYLVEEHNKLVAKRGKVDVG